MRPRGSVFRSDLRSPLFPGPLVPTQLFSSKGKAGEIIQCELLQTKSASAFRPLDLLMDIRKRSVFTLRNSLLLLGILESVGLYQSTFPGSSGNLQIIVSYWEKKRPQGCELAAADANGRLSLHGPYQTDLTGRVVQDHDLGWGTLVGGTVRWSVIVLWLQFSQFLTRRESKHHLTQRARGSEGQDVKPLSAAGSTAGDTGPRGRCCLSAGTAALPSSISGHARPAGPLPCEAGTERRGDGKPGACPASCFVSGQAGVSDPRLKRCRGRAPTSGSRAP